MLYLDIELGSKIYINDGMIIEAKKSHKNKIKIGVTYHPSMSVRSERHLLDDEKDYIEAHIEKGVEEYKKLKG